MILLSLLLIAPQPEQVGYLRTLVITVRAEVIQTCWLSPLAEPRCRGATDRSPPRILRSSSGVTIIEF
ncbi:hypothetical protein D3876_18125 [Sphingomonas cavernae]|uniref:Uncharacterized protein n=1 Tax=Sphingomonas cavernae TaxID=2320861 RepID=A0A418W7G4_9SPHN|nr:hypothetical protein D3876_18125 [Sphingomonas cavernae]